MRVVHYPWRVGLASEEKTDLPVPEADAISPAIGAFATWEDGSIEELAGPEVNSGSGQDRLEIRHGTETFGFSYSRQAQQYQKYGPESPCRKLQYSLADLFIRMSDFLYQYRDKSGNLLADRSISEASDNLRDYLGSDKDFAPESLIVRIARETPAALKDIVENPRVVLKRVHRQVPLDRMQEVDVYALQDLARRPGRTSAMKAGPRQRLMAVVRAESADTYENRVVRTFIELAAKNARQYKGEMCSRCPRRNVCETADPMRESHCPSERVKTVTAFSHFCSALLNVARFGNVAKLSEPKTVPNYVLQQNPRYLNIWKFYLRLLRQENIEADVWVWRRRTWADAARLIMMHFWNKTIPTMSGFIMQTSRKPFMIRHENDRGAWLCSDPFEDAAVFKAVDCQVTFYMLNSAEFAKLTGSEDFCKLNADFYWVSLASSGQFRTRVMPVWCFCPDRSWEKFDGVFAENVCRETKALLSRISAQHPDYDLSQSLVLFPGETPVLKAIGDHRFYQVNLFDLDCLGKVFDKLEGWMERITR